jgi:hypothetical protein
MSLVCRMLTENPLAGTPFAMSLLHTRSEALNAQFLQRSGKSHDEKTATDTDESARSVLSEAFRDLATARGGALLFGQFLIDRPFVGRIAIAGAAIWIVLVVVAVIMAGSNDGR